MAFFIIYTKEPILPDIPGNPIDYPVYVKKIHNSTQIFNLSRIWYD